MAYLFPDIEITDHIDFFNSLKHQKRLIPKWLSPLEPHQRHHGLRTNRVNGVGNWFLETDELRNWSGASGGDGYVPPVLFCYGDPGVGKTYLSSVVIDHLCDQTSKRDAVAGLYCDFLAQHEQTTPNMLGAILKQLINRGEIPEHVKQAFKKAKSSSSYLRPRLPDLLELIKVTVASLPQVLSGDKNNRGPVYRKNFGHGNHTSPPTIPSL